MTPLLAALLGISGGPPPRVRQRPERVYTPDRVFTLIREAGTPTAVNLILAEAEHELRGASSGTRLKWRRAARARIAALQAAVKAVEAPA